MRHPETHHRQWLIMGALIAAFGLGALVWQGAVGQAPMSPEDARAVATANALSRAFNGAAEKVIPAVVKITSTTKARVIEEKREEPSPENPFEGTPFEDLFKDNPFPGFRFRYRVPPSRGLGSGVIIDRTGIILTNNHVVAGADEVLVELADGREFHVKAEQIKTDELTDLALLRIKAEDPLPAATLGDSDSLQIGDWVLAVGNPFELEHTVSAGIISGKGRSLTAGKRASFLQTDAAINPGNSGGPLVNLRGEVVGINTAIASSTGGYQGVGFAIPSKLAKRVTDELIKSGRVARAYLGVGIEETTSDLGRRLGVADLKGVLAGSLYRDTPAAAAGFQLGDVIRTFGGRPVRNPRELQDVVERSPIGSKQKAEIVRDGKPKTLQVVVQSLPDDFGRASVPSRIRGEDESPGFVSREFGLQVKELTEEAARQLRFQESSGALVAGVVPGGPAYLAGIHRGMLIREVEKKSVKSLSQFAAALKGKSLEDGVLLTLRSEKGDRYVLLRAS